MKHVSSRENALFKQLKKLAASARERRKSQLTLLDGIHLVAAYLDKGNIPEILAVAASSLENAEVSSLVARLPETRLVVLEDGLFNEISTVETATGIVAVIPIPVSDAVTDSTFCVMLEAIQDPGNLGSILRSAAAAGCDLAYLSPGCVDAWSPKVLRAGMGAHFSLALREHQDLAMVAREFPGKVLAAALHAEKSLFQSDLRGKVAFIVGNEGAGISARLLEEAGETIRIPMPGGMESLNAGAAAAICLFERVRQLANTPASGRPDKK
jgi:TrmH family RNA methyltransferase